MNLDNVRPGDLLYRTKGLVEHAGIYLGNNQVFHNSPDNDVEVVSFEQYAAGKEVKVILKSIDDVELLSKQLKLIIAGSKKYSVISNNCEHFANILIAGRAYSPQIMSTIIGALVMGFLSKGKGWTALIGRMILGGAAGCAISNAMRKYDGTVIDHLEDMSALKS